MTHPLSTKSSTSLSPPTFHPPFSFFIPYAAVTHKLYTNKNQGRKKNIYILIPSRHKGSCKRKSSSLLVWYFRKYVIKATYYVRTLIRRSYKISPPVTTLILFLYRTCVRLFISLCLRYKWLCLYYVSLYHYCER